MTGYYWLSNFIYNGSTHSKYKSFKNQKDDLEFLIAW